ncbi:MAG TPA: hypothetical protein VJN93_00080 [Candidatus Acidoferrum sp.]|nr:hypothetical protein [Candidatus Acidoferrum sp.]
MKKLLALAAFSLLAAGIAAARTPPDRVLLFPKLRVGQVLRYRIGYRETRNTTTDSNVAAPMAPQSGETNADLLLQVEVEDLRVDAGISLARLRTTIVAPDPRKENQPARSSQAKSSPVAGASPPAAKSVELTLSANGHVSDVNGLDKLSPDEKAAWKEWVDRFGGGAAFPEKGIRPGEKWKSAEPIPNALLAGLSWEKESEYVNNQPCSSMQVTPQGDPIATPAPQESCAVILTTAVLKQKSSPKNATPEDYKLHDLHNAGSAQGKNQVISYFSLTTGLLVRSTEDANQSMNVTVATSNGSNSVHYSIAAESHSRVQLLAGASSAKP